MSPNSRLNAALRPGGAKSWCRFAGCCALAGFLAGQGLCADANNNSSPPYGLTERPTTKPYLEMPETDRGSLPPKLSQTGAFKNTAALTPSESLIPYDINLAFYSDGAAKARWIALPKEGSDEGKKIKFTPSGEWQFPDGTVFVKHFEMVTDETHPESRRRLETRLIVRQANGGVYGATYKWRPDNSDADLLSSNLTETLEIRTATGIRTQNWYYPSRLDCRTCHSSTAGGVLGVKTRQLNREMAYPSGVADNELRALAHIGLFSPAPSEPELAKLDRLAPAEDTTRGLEDRARSYLDVNCAYCHRPGGTVAYFDARFDTSLQNQGLVNGRVLIDEGLDRARVIAPNDPWRSVALLRISSLEGLKMPPLAHETLDQRGTELLKQWILSMPGPKVLPPPSFSSKGGPQQQALTLRISHPDLQVAVHYTLDGSAPTLEDPIYNQPIKLSESTTVRARAFRQGYTKSIVIQETFVFAAAQPEKSTSP